MGGPRRPLGQGEPGGGEGLPGQSLERPRPEPAPAGRVTQAGTKAAGVWKGEEGGRGFQRAAA